MDDTELAAAAAANATARAGALADDTDTAIAIAEFGLSMGDTAVQSALLAKDVLYNITRGHYPTLTGRGMRLVCKLALEQQAEIADLQAQIEALENPA